MRGFLKNPALPPDEDRERWREARIPADEIVRKKILKKAPGVSARGCGSKA
jgi:hypothetical protein